MDFIRRCHPDAWRGRQPSLDVYLASLGKEALAVVRELPESDHAVPLGAFLLLAVSILESRLGCD